MKRRRDQWPLEMERRLNAIHESDKSLMILLGPIVGGFINFFLVLWCLGMVVAVARSAEATILLLIAAIPLLLLWLLGRWMRRVAAQYRREREKPASG